jgi:uncharacterized protein YndB with AHSA1/START domain
MSSEVRRETKLPADRERAWEALTDPEGLEAWFAEDAELDPRPGGEVRFTMPGGEERDGFVEEAADGERLVFWWGPSEGDRELSRVEMELEDAEDGTLLRIVETRHPITVETVTARTGSGGGATDATLLAAVG